MDLLDLYRGDLTPRKLGVLVDGLPPESLTMTAIRNSAPEPRGDEPVTEFDAAQGRWSSAEMLMATMIDEIRLLRWTYVSAHAKNGGGAPPEPVRRPGGTARRPRSRLTAEQRRALDPRLRIVEDDTA